MSSVICFNLDQSKILSSGNGLNVSLQTRVTGLKQDLEKHLVLEQDAIHVKFAEKGFQRSRIWNDTKKYIQVKNHLNVKFVINDLIRRPIWRHILLYI